MMTRTEITLARRDFAELRELIKGKTIPELISEVETNPQNLIGICNVLDANAGTVEDYSQAGMVDVNFKSLNLTIFKDDAGLCTIDERQSSVEIYSWYDKENGDVPIGELSYKKITSKT